MHLPEEYELLQLCANCAGKVKRGHLGCKPSSVTAAISMSVTSHDTTIKAICENIEGTLCHKSMLSSFPARHIAFIRINPLVVRAGEESLTLCER